MAKVKVASAKLTLAAIVDGSAQVSDCEVELFKYKTKVKVLPAQVESTFERSTLCNVKSVYVVDQLLIVSVLTPLWVSHATVGACPTAKLTSPAEPLFPLTVIATAAATPVKLKTAQINTKIIGFRAEILDRFGARL